jgi:cytochrome P450
MYGPLAAIRDFVGEIAAALPLEIICDMMGIPPTDYRRILELTNTCHAALGFHPRRKRMPCHFTPTRPS